MSRARCLTAGAGVLAVAGVAAGFTIFLIGAVPVTWPDNETVRFLSPTTFPPGSATENLFLAAMGQWSDVPEAEFQYLYATNPKDYAIDNFDGFSDTIAVAPEELDPGVLAITVQVNSSTSWYDMDMLINAYPLNLGWSFAGNPSCVELADPSIDGFNFLLVSLHELGHGVGLCHSPIGDEPAGSLWPVTSMNPIYPEGGTMGQEHVVELHTDDKNGARYLYPASGPSNPPFRDLASAEFAMGPFVGAAVPVFFDPPEVLPGDALTVRSVIENLGTTSEFFVHQGFYLSPDPTWDPADMLIGEIEWDLAFGDFFEFDALLVMPADLASGDWYVATSLDDEGEFEEVYEDNNWVVYCDPLTVTQLVPVIDPIPQQEIIEGTRYTGPLPVVTHPLNMNPITWTLEDAPAGMSINPTTGVVSWPDPVHSEFLYTILLRATNDAGSSTQFLFLGVLPEPDNCPADCAPGTGDGVVDTIDFLVLLAEFASNGPFDCDLFPPGGDGVVDTRDFLALLGSWGDCP